MSAYKRVAKICTVIAILVVSVCEFSYGEKPQFKRLGPQISSTVVQAAAFTTAKNGDTYVFTVVRGTPAYLVGYKNGESNPSVTFKLNGTGGSWDMTTATDGSVYMTGDQSIYRYVVGDKSASNLGTVLPGEKSVWVLVPGENGEVFGGTFPGGKVFRYHPDKGFTDFGKGSIVEGEQYVRSLVFNKGTKKMYAGIGSHAQLIEYDAATGQKTNILPAEYADYQFVYDMGIVEGTAKGDFLFASVTGSGKEATVLVFDLKSREVIAKLPGSIKVKSIIKGRQDGLVYYTSNNQLYSIDLTKMPYKPIVVSDDFGSSYAMQWEKDLSLTAFNSRGSIVNYKLESVSTSNTVLNLPKQPIPIHSILNGPDGRVWSAGYLSGGTAAYDPIKDATIEYPGLSQAEGMVATGNHIYFGVYTGANFYKYDVTQPWNVRKKSPQHLGKVEGQDRPFGSVAMESRDAVFFGTVPTYGKLGGSIVKINKHSDEIVVYPNVIHNQSIVTLIDYKGVLIGGSTISGGLGMQPSEKEAKLFFWDVDKGKVIYETVPVPGKRSITGLALDPDGMIWGMADGTLFVFDPEKKEVVKEIFLHKVPSSGHIWRNGSFVFHPHGTVYGTASNGLFKIEPKSMKLTFLQKDAHGVVLGSDENLYYIKEGELWSAVINK